MAHYKVTFSLAKNGQNTQETRDYHVSGEADLNFQIGVYIEAAKRMGFEVTDTKRELVN